MKPGYIQGQRRAAWAFLALMAPLAVAIMAAGGGIALAPLLLLLVPILLTGRAPGIELLGRAIARRRKERGPRRLATPAWSAALQRAHRSLLHLGPPVDRGPPLRS